MKLAILRFVYEEGACPWELAEALWCKSYQGWPRNQDRGLAGQDATELLRYAALESYYEALSKQAHGGGKGMSAAERRLVGEVLNLELEQPSG